MRVFAALTDDISEGWVWLGRDDLPPRSTVCIENRANGRVVYCEALRIDENFLRQYNQAPRIGITEPKDAIVLGGWYRSQLGGLQAQADYDLAILRPLIPWWGKFWTCAGHPQIVVRIAAWLAVWSVVLGALGAALGVVGISASQREFTRALQPSAQVERPSLARISESTSWRPSVLLIRTLRTLLAIVLLNLA